MSLLEWTEWVLFLAGCAALHLSWQTLWIGGMVAAVERLAPRLPPRYGYRIGFVLFACLPILAAATVAWTIAPGDGRMLASGVPGGSGDVRVSLFAVAAPGLGLAWLLGTLLALRRAARDVVAGERLRARGERVSNAILETVLRQARRIGVAGGVDIRWSAEIETPAVVGLRTPTILLPSGLPLALPRAEREALVAHELAHIRRNDLLARSLQRIVEGLLFFHPLAPWLSRTIDRNRELACDDLVTSSGVRRRTYARALARTAVRGGIHPASGLGAGAGDVAARVRRLTASDGDDRSSGGHRAMALAGLLAAFAVSLPAALHLASASREAARTAPAWETRVLVRLGDSFQVDASDPAGEFTLSVERGRAVGASVAGDPVPPKAIEQRGSRVTLPAGTDGGTFVVRIVEGGIEWSARRPG